MYQQNTEEKKPRLERTEKQWIHHWDQLVKSVLDLTPVDEEEPVEVQKERVSWLEANPEEWFRYYFPRYSYALPAPFQVQAAQRILENKEWYEVRLWSRELAKSTRTMMEVMYLTLVGHVEPESESSTDNPVPRHRKRYVLLVSNSLENAIRLLMPYKANLEFNKRIKQDYGMQQTPGNWEMTEFTTQSGVAFRALGAGQSPRGARNEEVRPDIIIFDDVDTDADCLNHEIVTKKWHWIEEAAIGTRSISQPTTIIFCGNRIATDCCVGRATKFADHVHEMNIRGENGRSTWPQKNKEVDIDRILSQKSYAAAQKEYFNNPVTEGSVFKQMAYKPARPIDEYTFLVCYTDPSYKTTHDYKATVLVGKWRHEFHVIKCYLAQTTTAQMIDWHYRVMELVGSNACYYFMEEVFMQDVLVKEVSNAGILSGRTIPIRGDKRKKPDKFMRIESLLEPLHRNGQLYLNEDERQNPYMLSLAEQFIMFGPGSRAHDDGPDAVEGAIWQIMQKESKGTGEGIIPITKPINENRW